METLRPERELDWDDEIARDSNGFVLLPEGDYPFTIKSFTRERHNGSAKLPPCNKVALEIEVTGDEGDVVTIKHQLFLHSRMEGMLCAFFVAIGDRKRGEPLKMNWTATVGKKGNCHVFIDKYVTADGSERIQNKIKYFIDPNDAKKATPPIPPEPTSETVAPVTTNFKPGVF